MQALRPDTSLTVVVIPLVGGAALDACLATLRKQAAHEILVVPRGILDTPAEARLLLAPPGSNVPERRMIGLKAANSRLVAFIEDTCQPEQAWSDALCAAFVSDDVLAAGGPVHVGASLTPQLKALAISEYSRFRSAGNDSAYDTNGFAGANFAVRREALDPAALPKGLVDNFVFDLTQPIETKDHAQTNSYAQPAAYARRKGPLVTVTLRPPQSSIWRTREFVRLF